MLGLGALYRAWQAARTRRKAIAAKQVAMSTARTRENAAHEAAHRATQHARFLAAREEGQRKAGARRVGHLAGKLAARRAGGKGEVPLARAKGLKLKAGPLRVAHGGGALAGAAQRGRAGAGWAAWRGKGKGQPRPVGLAPKAVLSKGVFHVTPKIAPRAVGGAIAAGGAAAALKGASGWAKWRALNKWRVK